MSDIDHTRDCILPSDGKAEGLVKASELFALTAERDALRAENEKLRAALEEVTQWSKPHDRVNIIARAALKEDGDD